MDFIALASRYPLVLNNSVKLAYGTCIMVLVVGILSPPRIPHG
jgi:hypothetical protein